MRRLASALLAAALIAVPALAVEPAKPAPSAEEITVIGKRPVVTPDTSYWVEDGFTDYPLLGPNFAKGLIVWNHPETYYGGGADLPPIKVIEGLAALGWDVVRLQRNSRLKPGISSKLDDVRDALASQLAAAQREGYPRIILAGQQVGGALALEAGKEIDGLYAIVAFAPNSGIAWMGAPRHPAPFPTDGKAGIVLSDNKAELEQTHAGRLFLLYPALDQEVPHERGPTARAILGQRDMPFLLVDETSGVRTTEGAETPDFSAYASCLDLFLEPDLTPHAGEFHCAADEIPTALAQMGVKPHGGEGWFGYSSRGQTIYLELPAQGQGTLTYGWGAGANGKTRPGSKALAARFAGETFTADLAADQLLRGVRHGPLLRVTLDLADGTRAEVTMRRVAGSS